MKSINRWFSVSRTMDLSRAEVEYVHEGCLTNLLAARAEGEGWFMAAPGYAPYGNYVWHRDNAECAMAIDEYAEAHGEARLFEASAKAILRSFLYFESKGKGVHRLLGLKGKVTNPDFYESSNHLHARLSCKGEELSGPWNNIQYDSVARLVVALAKHVRASGDAALLERCKPGLRVALEYLVEAIWDGEGHRRMLTVSANEWEERDEPHLRRPLFASVVGVLYASAAYYAEVLQQHADFRDLDVQGFRRQTLSMLEGFFVRDYTVRMLKRFEEQPVGRCSTSLWLLTSLAAFPAGGEVFERTLDSLMRDGSLLVSLRSGERGAVGLRRYEIGEERAPGAHPARPVSGYVDTYWGGQAWIITTAQLATALAIGGRHSLASDILSACIGARDADGRLPEQIDGTCSDPGFYQRWREWTGATSPAPWLAWSHAEVLRAYTTILNASRGRSGSLHLSARP